MRYLEHYATRCRKAGPRLLWSVLAAGRLTLLCVLETLIIELDSFRQCRRHKAFLELDGGFTAGEE